MKKSAMINTRLSEKEISILNEVSNKHDISVSKLVRASIAPFIEDVCREKIEVNLNKGWDIYVVMREAAFDFNRT